MLKASDAAFAASGAFFVYEKEDETELVIRVLSFGPMIKVTAPQSFAELIKQRLIAQKSCIGLPPSAQNEVQNS